VERTRGEPNRKQEKEAIPERVEPSIEGKKRGTSCFTGHPKHDNYQSLFHQTKKINTIQEVQGDAQIFRMGKILGI